MAVRTVLVTGGARGIGKGIAKAFMRRGCNVVIADLKSETQWQYGLSSHTQMEETLSDLRKCGNVTSTHLDVTDFESCKQAVAMSIETYGSLDVLIDTAGIIDSGPIDSFPDESWNRIFDVNVKGIYNMTRAALSHLKSSDNAAIVNTASIAGKRGSANLSCYCASKFAVVGLTQSLAQELAPTGIRVNAICPGIVGTAMWLDHLMESQGEKAFEERMKRTIPLQRPQTNEDMGEAAVYLASSKNVTGVALSVAGGLEIQ